MENRENAAPDFDNLCQCGRPDCPVGDAARLARLLYEGKELSKAEGVALAEGFAAMVQVAKRAAQEAAMLGVLLEAIGGEGQRPGNNPFLS